MAAPLHLPTRIRPGTGGIWSLPNRINVPLIHRDRRFMLARRIDRYLKAILMHVRNDFGDTSIRELDQYYRLITGVDAAGD